METEKGVDNGMTVFDPTSDIVLPDVKRAYIYANNQIYSITTNAALFDWFLKRLQPEPLQVQRSKHFISRRSKNCLKN